MGDGIRFDATIMTSTDELTILANPGHGNGPTVALLMAAEAIERHSRASINLLFPYLPGTSQRAVIHNRRAKTRRVRVFFDARLGELLRWVTLRNNDFKQNVRDVVDYQPHVQCVARSYVRNGLRDLIELLPDGTEVRSTRSFGKTDLTIELSHGSRLRVLDPGRAFYFFPCLLSDLLMRPAFTSGLRANLTARALALVRELEEGFAAVFLPHVHTFTGENDWQPPSHARVRFTPFPRPRGEPHQDTKTKPPGVFLMPSGVGQAGDQLIVEAAKAILNEAKEKLKVYYPDPFPVVFKESFPDSEVLTARSIPNENIRLIVGRAGWGTLWECLNASKVFVAIPAIQDDDPEISLNLQTLSCETVHALNRSFQGPLAMCWQPGTSIWDKVDQVKKNIDALIAGFGRVDGLDFMAEAIGRLTTRWR